MERTNEDRANDAGCVLDGYRAWALIGGRAVARNALVGLVRDLQHLADTLELDWDELEESARSLHQYDVSARKGIA